MKSVTEKIRFIHWNSYLKLNRAFETSSTPTSTTAAALTHQQLNQINALIPQLCASNHLGEAINLISAAVSTPNPPLSSLSLSPVITALAQQPDLTHSMHLLNTLKFNPNTGNPLFLLPIAEMFVSSFFRQGCPKRAVKIFQWVLRPDFPGGVVVDLGFYAVLIDGLCKHGMILDSLRVVRVMASENLMIGSEVRKRIYMGLLREARVREALELNSALELNAALEGGTPGNGGGTFGSKEVVDLLDKMIATWAD